MAEAHPGDDSPSARIAADVVNEMMRRGDLVEKDGVLLDREGNVAYKPTPPNPDSVANRREMEEAVRSFDRQYPFAMEWKRTVDHGFVLTVWGHGVQVHGRGFVETVRKYMDKIDPKAAGKLGSLTRTDGLTRDVLSARLEEEKTRVEELSDDINRLKGQLEVKTRAIRDLEQANKMLSDSRTALLRELEA